MGPQHHQQQQQLEQQLLERRKHQLGGVFKAIIEGRRAQTTNPDHPSPGRKGPSHRSFGGHYIRIIITISFANPR